MSSDVGKARKDCRMNCNVGEAMKGLENEALPFRCFNYIIGTSHTSPGKPSMPNSGSDLLVQTSTIQVYKT